VLLHLVEEKKLFRQDEQWNSNLTIEEMGIPEGIRQVIGRRLSRLSDEANRFLAVASAFSGDFRFDIAVTVAGLAEGVALGVVDEALAAQLIRPGSQAEWFDFTHALFRHTLYSELSPPRQVRSHRQIAEAMERIWSEMQDGRLSLARLCALQGRYGEATDWFAKVRTLLFCAMGTWLPKIGS
jgi:predicted ATPase